MSYETILVENNEGVLTLTMNRPERLNAWTYQMGAELTAAITAGNADDSVIAFVLTGAGRGFCAGADIQDVFAAQSEKEGGGEDLRANANKEARANNEPINWVDLVRGSKPMVAAVNGAAIGVGLTQILPMDSIVASDSAKLSVRFIKMGVVPELASSHYLPARVGFGAANELMLTGKTVSATEAHELGMVDKLASADTLLEVAHATAKAMGENPQAALLMVKELITENMGEGSIAEVQRREMKALGEAYKSPEHKEAIAAFLEKREPDFAGARKSG